MVFTARPSGRAVSFLIAIYFASGASVYHKAPGLSSGRKYRLKHALFRLVRNIFLFSPYLQFRYSLDKPLRAL
jgi:hypothetical protein